MCSRTCPAWCARPGSVLFCFVLFCFCFVQCLGPAMGLALPDGPCPPRRALPPSMGTASGPCPGSPMGPASGPCPGSPMGLASGLCLGSPMGPAPPDGPCQRPVPGLPDGPCPRRTCWPCLGSPMGPPDPAVHVLLAPAGGGDFVVTRQRVPSGRGPSGRRPSGVPSEGHRIVYIIIIDN